MCGRLLLVIAGSSMVLAACATSGDERAARATVERFNAALERRDGESACRELSGEAAGELERSERKPCPRAIFSLELVPSEVGRVEVFSRSARADLTGGGTTFLDETSQGWRISALGCEPRPERPYECELEV